MPHPLTADILSRLVPAYTGAADPERAAQSAAYMRDQFPFLGLSLPTLRTLTRTALAGVPAPTEADLRHVALACWELDEREYQYFACDWLRRHVRVVGPDFIGTTHTLITTKSWWDTVDPLATRFVGDLVRAHPQLIDVMEQWAADDEAHRCRRRLDSHTVSAPRLVESC